MSERTSHGLSSLCLDKTTLGSHMKDELEAEDQEEPLATAGKEMVKERDRERESKGQGRMEACQWR